MTVSIWRKFVFSPYGKKTDNEECLLFNSENKIHFNYPLLIGETFDRFGIDTIGPLPESECGNRYILVAIDYLSKYVIIKATRNKSMIDISNFIYEDIITNYGCPAIILTDNGREYKNSLVENLCDKMKITKKYSKPYRSQTNGLVEKTNKIPIAI